MTEPKDGPGPSDSFAEAEQVALYEPLGVFLVDLLRRAFELPERDAERLVRDTFIDYGLNRPAPNAREWLIAAVCREANRYRQQLGLPAANEAEVGRQAATALSLRDAIREAMEKLPSRAREALRLKFEAKKSYAEVARELGMSTHAAERYVVKALTRLRALLRRDGTQGDREREAASGIVAAPPMPRVLIAEDDYDIRRLVTHLLERDGYEVDAVDDGAKAIEKITTERFDAILLDFMLPVATGSEVIDWIEQNRPEVGQSCVIISAAAEAIQRYDTSRVYAAVAKPFDISQLRGIVRKCIDDRQRES